MTGVGGRPFFARNKVSTVSDAILLENTDQGYNWNLAFEARRPFRNGFFASAGYSYGEAKSIMDGTSDQAASNWGNVYIPADPNNPPLGALELRSGSPHHLQRRLRHPDLSRSSRPRSRCSTRDSRAAPTR